MKKKKNDLQSIFSQRTFLRDTGKTTCNLENKKVCFHMSQHKGLISRAFFCESTASETLKFAIARNTISEETSKSTIFAADPRVFPHFGFLFGNLRRVDKTLFCLKSFEEGSRLKCKEKFDARPKMRKRSRLVSW